MIVPQNHTLCYAYATMEQFAGFEHNGALQWDKVKEYAGLYSESNGDQYARAPVVRWLDNGQFKVLDGRHRMLALIGAGYRYFLVRWLEPLS